MFGRALLVLTALTIALPAAAQTRPYWKKRAANQASFDDEMQERRRRTMSPFLMDGIGIGISALSFSSTGQTSSEVDRSAYGQTNIRETNDASTGGSKTYGGLTLSYATVPRLGAGVIGELSYLDDGGSANYKLFRPALSIAYGGARTFYGFAGVNTILVTNPPKIEGVKNQDVQFNPGFGGQVGAGFVIGGFEGKLQYSLTQITMNGSYRVDSLSTNGVILNDVPVRIDATLNVGVGELSLQYRF